MNSITRQSTTDDELLNLIGVSQWVFNSNVGFIIELIDKEHHSNSDEPWIRLIEMMSGKLLNYKNKIKKILGNEIYLKFKNLIDDRNAIVHSFPTGEKIDNYFVAIYRNDSKHKNIVIDKEFLYTFIKENEELSSMLHKFRTY